jgi:hypothetical protein
LKGRELEWRGGSGNPLPFKGRARVGMGKNEML